MMKRGWLCAPLIPWVFFLADAVSAGVVDDPRQRTPQAVEVGTVRWSRDFDGALEKSASTGRPVFALFQEVPGCDGCRQFGREVLSHPDIVRAVEELFVPLLIYNNRPGGRDAELLERYGEPAWNYQVVRFLDASGRDIIPRRDRVWSLEAVASRMAAALRSAGREVPRFLDRLRKESAPVP